MNYPQEILVLDANEIEKELIRKVLGSSANCHEMVNSIELEAFFSAMTIDLIIADDVALGGDPLATIARLQVLTDAPIILKSKRISLDFKRQAFNCGIQGLISSPLIEQELSNSVEPVLKNLGAEDRVDVKNNTAVKTILSQRHLNQSIFLHLNQLIELLSSTPNVNTNDISQTEQLNARWLDACLLEIQTIYQNNRRLDNSFKNILNSIKADLSVVPNTYYNTQKTEQGDSSSRLN